MSEDKTCPLAKSNPDLVQILGTADRVVALFYASWCPFCLTFLPIFEKLAESKGLCFVKVQDDEDTIADQYSVEVYPTVIYFENGSIAKRLDGVRGVGLNEQKLKGFINLCLSI